MWFEFLTLFTALTISGVAAYYSIIGLTAIFAAAFWPIVIMGGVLEFGKIVTSVWLKKYWHQASLALKIYLTFAVAVLMLITSMGIFGFLSKAHLDQAVPTGDVAAKVQLLDEKIKTERDNIETARRALLQMDAQVDQRLSRSNDDKGAERAVQIRRQQAKERQQLQNEIAAAQKKIAALNEERAPIASELRKVEAEVGPIKYVAALIYGDNPDTNLLEKAVRWVIIIIVIVFDPLAIALILAANSSMRWAAALPPPAKKEEDVDENIDIDHGECPKCTTKLMYAPGIGPFCPNNLCDVVDGVNIAVATDSVSQEPEVKEEPKVDSLAYLKKPWNSFTSNVPHIPNPPIISEEPKQIIEPTVPTEPTTEISEPVEEKIAPVVETRVIEQTEFVTVPETAERRKDPIISPPEAMNVRRKTVLPADNTSKPVHTSFGTAFPNSPNNGDVFLRVDYVPNKEFKFNGQSWIEVDKTKNDSYTDNAAYITFLADKLKSEIEQDLVDKNLTQSSNDKTQNIDPTSNT